MWVRNFNKHNVNVLINLNQTASICKSISSTVDSPFAPTINFYKEQTFFTIWYFDTEEERDKEFGKLANMLMHK